jgi:hypothetical protein
MIRYLTAVFALALTTTACSPTIVPLTVRDPAEPLFVRVLEGTASERTEALAAMKKEYPDSPWTSRARTAAELLRSRDALSQKVKQAEQEKGVLQQEKTVCQQDNQGLQQETSRLREDLDKLKKLLIDMEKRAAK